VYVNALRRLAWAAVLVGSGVRSTEAPRPEAPIPASHQAQPASQWPADLDEDEFEGGAWSFWPLPPCDD
jgi:hypothetical protein